MLTDKPRHHYRYRAYIEIRGDSYGAPRVYRYGGKTFRTRREALFDAVKIIREVKNDPTIQWRNEIETYGSVRDD